MGMIKNFLVHRRAGLSKVAGCRQISPPTQLVSADYSAWHFFMDGIVLKKYPWTQAAYFDNSVVYFKTFWQPPWACDT